ncbi:hypothetical protein ACV52Z_001877 [Campylobacter coli]
MNFGWMFVAILQTYLSVGESERIENEKGNEKSMELAGALLENDKNLSLNKT